MVLFSFRRWKVGFYTTTMLSACAAWTGTALALKITRTRDDCKVSSFLCERTDFHAVKTAVKKYFVSSRLFLNVAKILSEVEKWNFKLFRKADNSWVSFIYWVMVYEMFKFNKYNLGWEFNFIYLKSFWGICQIKKR